MTGETARRLARYRSPIPLLAFTTASATRSQLALTWGAETFLVPPVAHTDDMVRQVEAALLQIARCADGDLVVLVAGSPPGTPGRTNALRVHRIGDPSNPEALGTRVPGKQRAHERPFVAEHAAALVPDPVGRHEVRMLPEQPAVLLIRGEAGEAEQGQRLVARALGGQEVAMVVAAMAVDQIHPPPGEALEGVGLRRIDDVLDDAGDHDGRLAKADGT
jgi:hypothetical protein